MEVKAITQSTNCFIFRIQNTGCFRGNEIMFLLISQPIKHFNSFDMYYIFTESIAFWLLFEPMLYVMHYIQLNWKCVTCPYSLSEKVELIIETTTHEQICWYHPLPYNWSVLPKILNYQLALSKKYKICCVKVTHGNVTMGLISWMCPI